MLITTKSHKQISPGWHGTYWGKNDWLVVTEDRFPFQAKSKSEIMSTIKITGQYCGKLIDRTQSINRKYV